MDVPATLGPFEVRELIGSGGMGEVYRAHDARLGRDVALKVLPEALGADPDRRIRFLREARAAAQLDHPGITTIHEVGDADGRDRVGEPEAALVDEPDLVRIIGEGAELGERVVLGVLLEGVGDGIVEEGFQDPLHLPYADVVLVRRRDN